MIHGDHYDASISTETARTASLPGPWLPNVATEIINFQAKFKHTFYWMSESTKNFLTTGAFSQADILSVLENGSVIRMPKETSRKDCYKYTMIGPSLEETEDGTLINLSVTVIPNFDTASLSILRAFSIST